MPFEPFDKRTAAATKSPMVTIQRQGSFSLNKAAHAAIGSPDAVELLFDRENQLVGFRPVAPTSPRAFPVRPQGPNAGTLMVAGQAFTKYYAIDTSKARRYPIEVRNEDGQDILVVDLRGDSIEVTSPAGRRKQIQEAAIET